MKKLVIGTLAACLLASGAWGAAKASYDKHCLKCHGAAGDGKGKAGLKLKPAPTDFTSEKFQQLTDDQIFEATKLGSKAKSVEVNKKMPAYAAKLSDAEIKELVQQLRGFGKK